MLELFDFDVHAILGKKGEGLAIKCTPQYKWNNETKTRTSERIASAITVVVPEREFIKILVTIPNQVLDDLFIEGQPPLRVTFEGFVGKFYQDFSTNEVRLSAKASKMVVLK